METGLFRELEHHLKQGRDHEALQLVHIELSKTPNDWNSLYLVAWVYRSLDRYAEAEEYYKKSLAVKSDAYPTHLGLGITYQLMED